MVGTALGVILLVGLLALFFLLYRLRRQRRRARFGEDMSLCLTEHVAAASITWNLVFFKINLFTAPDCGPRTPPHPSHTPTCIVSCSCILVMASFDF